MNDKNRPQFKVLVGLVLIFSPLILALMGGKTSEIYCASNTSELKCATCSQYVNIV